jgi:uncharacterized membrane protein
MATDTSIGSDATGSGARFDALARELDRDDGAELLSSTSTATRHGNGHGPSGGDPNVNVSLPERIASAVGGGALALYGARGARNSPAGAAAALAAGGYLLYRGITGRCAGYAALRTGTGHHADSETAVIPHDQGIKIVKAVTIDRPAAELFRFWRDFENLPRFMDHLESVAVQDGNRSHWVAKGPMGKTVEWDAEVINEKPDQMIAWRSLEGADVPNSGSVWFKELPVGRGTEVKVTLEYNPPAGVLGAAIARFWGEEPYQQVSDDLRRFKSVMEAGEIPTTEGQSHGGGAK